MASATPEALKIIRRSPKNGRKVSLSRAADAVLTIKALKDAGIAGHKAEFIMQVANRGGFDIGGPSRELARNAQGSAAARSTRASGSPRRSAITARRCHASWSGSPSTGCTRKDMPIDQMAQTTVRTLKESMWDYSSPNTAGCSAATVSSAS
jgi:hypothetical protein